jgi:septal ring factor EnvC (AmiA/AmiB activator)
MIEDLQFFRDRVELAGPDGYQLGHRSKDRTVAVVKRWMAVSSDLKKARSETMQTLEAVPGKGNSISLVVMDRERFDGLQEAIKAYSGQLKALDEAIKRLDETGGLWFSDLEDQIGQFGRVEGQERRQIANMTAAYIQRRANSGKTPDEILSDDPEFQRLKAICENAIKASDEMLAELRPKLAEMKQLLESVGC